jgi:hypothetical protein
MLDPRVADGLRAYGDDNLSAGVALAAAEAAERVGPKERKRALPDVREAMAAAPPNPDHIAKGSGRSLGRPLVGISPRVRTNLQLFPAVVEQLRIFGDGVVSQGIERAAILVRAVYL